MNPSLVPRPIPSFSMLHTIEKFAGNEPGDVANWILRKNLQKIN